MKQLLFTLLIALATVSSAWANTPTTLKPLKSPDGRMEVTFKLWDFAGGVICYNLYRDGKPVVLDSRLGFTLEWRDES